MLGVVAMGNELRGDDGVGLFAGFLLEEKGFPVVFAYENPENVMGELQGFERLLVLDAAHYEGEGPFVVSRLGRGGGYSHRVGLSKIEKFTGADVRVLGIKAYKRGMGVGISPGAKRNAREAAKVVEVCMAIPGVVVDAEKKIVKMEGEDKGVRFAVPGLEKGDFVLVHAGVAIEKLTREDYEKTREALDF